MPVKKHNKEPSNTKTTKSKSEPTTPNKVGRPLLYTDPDVMADRIEDYFKSITIDKPKFDYVLVGYEDEEHKKPIYEKAPVLNNKGEQIIETTYFKNPSIIDLAHHLGMLRDTLIAYSLKPEFFHTIKTARDRVERYLESELYRGQGQVTGIIFNLKNNFGWVDKQELVSDNTNHNYNYEAELQDLIK